MPLRARGHMPYITTIKTIEKTMEYWVPDDIIEKSHTNCGDSAYAYITKAQDWQKPNNLGEQEIDERIIRPVFPKTQVSD